MKNEQSYVIGGGISGIIFAYYNPDFTIISPDIGGQITHGIYNMTWMHDTKETRSLVDKLELFYDLRRIPIGYYYNGKINDDCSERKNTNIIMKKMFEWNKNSGEFHIDDRILSVPTPYIDTIDIDFNLIINKIKENIKSINDKVIKISKTQIFTESGIYNYDKLISTIPAPSFWQLYGKEKQFKYTPVTFIVSDEKPHWFDDKYEMVYIAEDYKFTRISNRRDGNYVYEFTGIITEQEFTNLYNLKIKKYFVNNFGRIHSCENIPPNNISFLGRFAEYKHSSKIQDVIKFSYDFNHRE